VVAEQVCLAIQRHERPSCAFVAKRVALSERTLQRKLKREGINLRAVVDGVRRELALKLLTDPELSVAQVAEAVGFREATSLVRALRRWTGESPTGYRLRHLKELGSND